jgi:hypothetical protein
LLSFLIRFQFAFAGSGVPLRMRRRFVRGLLIAERGFDFKLAALSAPEFSHGFSLLFLKFILSRKSEFTTFCQLKPPVFCHPNCFFIPFAAGARRSRFISGIF